MSAITVTYTGPLIGVTSAPTTTINVQPGVVVDTGGGGGPFSFVVNEGVPTGAVGGAEVGWYCFDFTTGILYGPRPTWPPFLPQTWPEIGQVAVGTTDSRLSDTRTPTAHNQAWSTITGTPTTLSGYGITDGGGMSIGAAITGAANNRILQSDASGDLAQQSTWYFDALDFGATFRSRQVLRSTKAGGGFVSDIDGGVVLGRTDNRPEAFAGYYGPGGGITLYPTNAYRWGNNTNDIRSSDTHLSRRAADVIEGAALAGRTYTVATAPSAATFIDCTVIFTDSSRGRRPCYSDGTNWRFYSDDAILS